VKTKVELILVPPELDRKPATGRLDTLCVVFDILRATSTIATALHNGAREVLVVSEIAEALALRAGRPSLLLAGEREGQRIPASLTGSIDFDLGNSPREFTRERVRDRSIVITTTNGTRAINSCRWASTILTASFLNLTATAGLLRASEPERIRLVCAGTGDDFSFEDTLGAGALLSLLPTDRFDTSLDSCRMAIELYSSARNNLEDVLADSVNGRRLAAREELRGDIAFCAQQDVILNPVRVTDNVARLVSGSRKTTSP